MRDMGNGTCPARLGTPTCECSFGRCLLTLGNIDLGMVASRDGCILDSVAVDGCLDISPFQSDAAVCLGDASEIPRRIQAC